MRKLLTVGPITIPSITTILTGAASGTTSPPARLKGLIHSLHSWPSAACIWPPSPRISKASTTTASIGRFKSVSNST